jgi:hypothetical protein
MELIHHPTDLLFGWSGSPRPISVISILRDLLRRQAISITEQTSRNKEGGYLGNDRSGQI